MKASLWCLKGHGGHEDVASPDFLSAVQVRAGSQSVPLRPAVLQLLFSFIQVVLLLQFPVWNWTGWRVEEIRVEGSTLKTRGWWSRTLSYLLLQTRSLVLQEVEQSCRPQSGSRGDLRRFLSPAAERHRELQEVEQVLWNLSRFSGTRWNERF